VRTAPVEAERIPQPKPSWVRSWLWVAVVAVLVAGGFAARQLARTGTKPGALARAYGFDIGDFPAISEEGSSPAPAMEARSFDGTSIRLADYRGKVVVINMWASWCGPCRREQPELERVWREYKTRGVQLLGLNERDQLAAARAFRDEFGVTYPSWIDDSSQLAFKLKAQVLPTTYIIDRRGRIVFRLTGTVDEAMLRAVLDSVLAKEPTGG